MGIGPRLAPAVALPPLFNQSMPPSRALAIRATPTSLPGANVYAESETLTTRIAAHLSSSGNKALATYTPSANVRVSTNQSDFGVRMDALIKCTGTFCSVWGFTTMLSLTYTLLTLAD